MLPLRVTFAFRRHPLSQRAGESAACVRPFTMSAVWRGNILASDGETIEGVLSNGVLNPDCADSGQMSPYQQTPTPPQRWVVGKDPFVSSPW